ncbi:hypothetical protein TTHERM_000122269 (macronuclear) [Tetrahymena thermophila SB210]|uniref:Uncharacterized protein n=1 Tax=Tetrahymena thermophila (strain SB210) TaxID=312017 RepID=W7XFZ5_TETTS|nr:hypothetical protein TTHERM_000122269 [Tetrahymena thermophila SB210]EWS75798.1 hypothetical protein TTHERM_000122269 [Tetrahymena thermophila SB210]|eukprot:XP_012651720.1 hypothetical protein TTHERM_000122269 [Tetrahymena thermophila SB210]
MLPMQINCANQKVKNVDNNKPIDNIILVVSGEGSQKRMKQIIIKGITTIFSKSLLTLLNNTYNPKQFYRDKNSKKLQIEQPQQQAMD